MIVVRIELASAISRDRDTDLGTMIIHNVATSEDGKVADYACDMYPKGTVKRVGGNARMLWTQKPHRSGKVEKHRRLAEPVHSLVAKALASMGYK